MNLYNVISSSRLNFEIRGVGVGGAQSSGTHGVKHVFTDHPQQLDFQISSVCHD